MQKLTINNLEGQKLAVLAFIPENEFNHVIIVCHGFRGGKENGGKIFSFASRLNELGLAVYAFDFRGSGESEGEFADITLSRQADDLSNIINYVDEKHHLPIILLGRSFGGSTVLAGGASDKRVVGSILWSAPVMLKQTFAELMRQDYSQLEQGQVISISDEAGGFNIKPDFTNDFDKHDMDNYLLAIMSKPVLIVHGLEDEVVEPANAEYMASHLEDVQIYLVEQADHRFNSKTRERENLTISWLKDKFLKYLIS